MSPAGDAARLAVGTLTVLPVRPPRRVDREVAGWAMSLAPLVGAAVGAAGWVAAALLTAVVTPLLAAVVVVVLMGAATRLIHWDGLADTADGLGSAQPPPAALEVMRRGDVGPFGVFTLVGVFAAQVAAVAELLAAGAGAGLVLAAMLGRVSLLAGCRAGVPAARPGGLGAAVAGSVDAHRLLVGLGLALGLTVLLVLVGPGLGAVQAGFALVVTALCAVAGTAYLRRRLGGMTGDTLGALVETSVALALLVLAATSSA